MGWRKGPVRRLANCFFHSSAWRRRVPWSRGFVGLRYAPAASTPRPRGGSHSQNIFLLLNSRRSPFVPAPTVVSTIRRCQSNTVGERERPAGTLVGLSPNSEAGLGSARVPQAGSGVAPELWPPTISGIPGGKKFAGCGFRRAAENHAPGADAPQRPQPGREPGRLAAVGHGNGGGKTQGQLNLRGACGWRPSALRLKAPFPLPLVGQRHHSIFFNIFY
jgi:hypothetical protein